ncbi:MAG: YqgE/AlgH family protein [Alphaproteobacteria bacterium]|nr:YqgE/AlgH family protein [Alphaproteobacteria bacterium]
MPLHRLVLLLGFLLAWVLPAGADLPKSTPDLRAGSLTGQLLVATQEIGDPRFAHTVILLLQHDREHGALGIVINRPAGERSWTSLLDAIGQQEPDAKGSVRVFAGGPVEPWLGFVLHSSDYHRAETVAVDAHISVTANGAILRDLARGKGPSKSRVAFGYAGWGPGQLESEIAMRAWFTEPADAKLTFDTDPDKLWDEAVAKRTLPL